MMPSATAIINGAQFLHVQKHPRGSAFVAQTEPFGVIVMR